jgi:hypothetical protein
MNANTPEYERRISSQIAQYANPERLLKLGPIYHYWINKHIRPRIAEVFGVNNALLFCAQYAAEALRQPTDRVLGGRRLRVRDLAN